MTTAPRGPALASGGASHRAPATEVGRRRRRRALRGEATRRLLTGILASTPLLVGATLDAARGWMPVGDVATIVLRSRDVLSTHMPLLGQYSEASAYLPPGRHLFAPGPTLYWFLALPAQAVGRWPAAPLLWTAVAEAGVVVAIVWLAHQLGGRVLGLATALGVVLVTASLDPRNLYVPWSVNVPVLPLLLLVFVTWAILQGSHRLLPVAVLLATFVVQADPSFGFVTVVLFLVVLVAALSARGKVRSSPGERRPAAGTDRRPIWQAAAVAIICWVPPLAQQLTTSPGNLTLIWQSSRGQGGREGLAFGLAILGKVSIWWALQRVRHVPLEAGSGAATSHVLVGATVLAVLVIVAVVARRGAARVVATGAGVALAFSIGLVLAAAMLPADDLAASSFWLLAWSPLVGMVVWAVVGWAAWTLALAWLGDHGRNHALQAALTADHRALDLAAVASVAAVVVTIVPLVRHPDPARSWYGVIRRATTELEHQPHHEPYAIDAMMAPTVPLVVGQALVLTLRAHGVDVGANNGFEQNLGTHYRLPRDGTVPRVVFYGDVNGYGFVSRPPRGGRLLAEGPVDYFERGRQVVARVVLLPPGRP